MSKFKLLVFVISLLSVGFFVTKVLANPPEKITICHATGSNSHPYITNQPDKTADVGGHDGHNGGVYPTNPWGDIIPPFDFDGGHYDGKNWTTEGQAIYNNGCKVPDEGPSHFACVENSCTIVDGEGSNTCSSDNNCGEEAQHYACERNSCVLVEGEGTDSCDPQDENACAETTPTLTPTPTETPSNPGGPGDGLGCATHDCSSHPAPQGQVLGASTKAVLGLSSTSSSDASTREAILLLGSVLMLTTGFAFLRRNA